MQDKFIGTWHSPWDDSLEAQVARDRGSDLSPFIDQIVGRLELTGREIVLDICCGNGLLTKIVSKRCKSIHGIDFSAILIDAANKESQTPNTKYYLHDALDLSSLFSKGYFDKCYCEGSLQYFNFENGKRLLEQLSIVTKDNGKIFIGNIPDRLRRSNFYDSVRKRVEFQTSRAIRMLTGRNGEDRLGWWWRPDQLREYCAAFGLDCEILAQDSSMPCHHYRFDALITNAKGRDLAPRA